MSSRLVSQAGVGVMRLMGRLPLSWVRALGWALGWLLYLLAVPRRRVARTNLRLCFPEKSKAEIRALVMGTFVHFAQAWLDRGWLWHGAPELVAGWTALTQQLPRHFTTIYTDQKNKVLDAWILAGRQRFGSAQLFGRVQGVKTIVAALRAGDPLYLLPDMNFGVEDSLFVPFYGVSAATVPSLSRFARLGRAKVVPVISRMTPQGYEVQVMPAWPEFGSDDAASDTARMNKYLQAYIDTMPDQYFWVHKRFKDRPPGVPPVY